MIDFHCHLDLFPDPKKVAEECNRKGLYVLSVTTTPSAWKLSNEIGRNYKRIQTALGLHPEIASEREKELLIFDDLIDQVKYVGEIGLDGSSQLKTKWDAQIRVFEHILQSCQMSGGKIMSIHSRKAVKSVLYYLEKYPDSGVPILHWFSGSLIELENAINLDCWFSINPAMLNSNSGRNLVVRIPKNRIVPETDAPFTGKNGKPYLPWEVENVIKGLSEIWNYSIEDVNKVIWNNSKSLLLSLI